MKTPFLDLGSLTEDQRIEAVIRVVRLGKIVGVLVDDQPGTLDRYLAKIKAQVPGLLVRYRGAGPVRGTMMAKVREAARQN